MKTSSIVKPLATVAALAAAGLVHAQSYPINGGWDRESIPNQVIGDYIDINQNPADPYGCVAALRGISLTVSNPSPAGFSALGLTFTPDGTGAGPTWSKSFPVDEPNGVCGLMPSNLDPFGPIDPITLSGTYRVIYKWGNDASCPVSDTDPALIFTAGTGTGTPNDWTCAELMVTADVDLVNNTFTPLSINLVVRGIDGTLSNSLTYDLY